MRKIISAFLILIAGTTLGISIEDKLLTKNVEVEEIVIENGKEFIELSDGSFGLINREKNIYSFQPVELGDWNLELESAEELNNVITTYLSLK